MVKHEYKLARRKGGYIEVDMQIIRWRRKRRAERRRLAALAAKEAKEADLHPVADVLHERIF